MRWCLCGYGGVREEYVGELLVALWTSGGERELVWAVVVERENMCAKRREPAYRL